MFANEEKGNLLNEISLLQDRSNSLIGHKKPNFDLQDLLIPADSPWTDSSRLNPLKGHYTEMGPGDWADKIKDDDSIRDDDSPRDDFFYQRYMPNMRKESPEFDIHRNKFDSDSDDSEMATSNSSELDMQYQLSLSKSEPNNAGRSKLEKSKSKTMKSPDVRYVLAIYMMHL